MKLDFNEERHEYKIDGVIVPSVTQLLKPLQDWSGIPQSVLERKAELGTALHLCCELHDKDILDVSTIDHRVKPYFDGYLKFLSEVRPKVILNETRLGHAAWRYAGQIDRLYEIQSWPWLVDLKSSATLHPWIEEQLAGYEELLLESEFAPGKEVVRGVLQLKPDGTYRLFPSERKAIHWERFKGLLHLHNWRVEHGY